MAAKVAFLNPMGRKRKKGETLEELYDSICDDLRFECLSSLEEDSGVSRTTLRNWREKITKKPQGATLQKVANCLGYKIMWVKG